MTKIYGRYKPCNDIPPANCGCDYKYCEHTKAVIKKYGSVFPSNSLLRQVSQILFDYQEASLERLCNLELPLYPLVQSMGFKFCNYEATPLDCVEICGGQYREYSFSNKCIEQEYDDDTLVSILQTIEYLNYPSRENIQAICDIFGWGLIYTEDYINILIGADDPAMYKAIIDLIPVPIGESIRILTDC